MRFRRFLCVLAAMLFAFMPTAMATRPRDIFPLTDEEIPAVLPGQHHYLMCCIDNWHGNEKNLGNTDGVLLVTLDTVQKRVLLTTFSREMLIKRPDGDIGRFTYIAKNYGMDALCDIVTRQFGVKVDKYIVFSMDNVQTIIDAMGGVDITVTDAEANYLNRYRISRTSTTPSMAHAGTYLFTGHAAVIYMRIRKVGGEGDSGRTRRIRYVLTTLAQKYANAGLNEALQLLSDVSNNLIMTNMSMADLLEAVGYAMELRAVTPEGLQMPPQDCLEPIRYAGMATRQVDFETSRARMAAFLAGEEVIDVADNGDLDEEAEDDWDVADEDDPEAAAENEPEKEPEAADGTVITE